MKFAEYKAFDLPAIQEEIVEKWNREKTFLRSVEMRPKEKPFVFFEGPPSANGMPGIHHVISRAIKDVICRYKTQQGFRVERRAGWDTHGLPVELGVEKSLGITKEDIGKTISVEEYNAACRTEVMKYTREWENLTQKMAYWIDMSNPYVTYHNTYIETVWYLIREIYKKGFLYKGYSIQPYSPAAGTGLSTHELNQPGCYKDVKDTTCTAQFEVIRDQVSEFLFSGTNASGSAGALPVMAGGLVNAVVAEEPAGENLVLDGISFHYPGRLTLFDNFSCVFRAGQITGIAGESGSGKSTLGSLLLRMYLPDAGSVRLGSRDACDIPLDTWRRIVGIVPQKADLFEGTILENIVLGDRTPDMDHVVTLCEELGLRPFLAALPRGILTPIGEQGVQLSGGQRQRLALARTAYRRPSWIVLDEATSSLDSTSEEAVLSALRKWSLLGTGIVIIGHRMSTLSIASRIILLDQGRIAEEGSHDELVRNNGNYAAWCRQQGL
jgi:ABC-type multidrug transport system fused ATPase/permease subunit